MEPKESRCRWTAGVYLAGGENVSREMIPALHDLRDVSLASRDALSIFAQFEPAGKPPRLLVFDEALLPTLARLAEAADLSLSTRARALAPTPLGLANYEHVLELPEGRAASGELLKRFVEMARAASGDGFLLLVISGHASGAVGPFLGFRTGREPLDLRDLGRALEQERSDGRRIDVLGMDCCHMSMVEVAYEVSSHVRFLVASEGSVLNHGWPYREILEAMVERSPREAAAEIARQYVGTYSDYALLGVDADCAVTDLGRLPLLTEPMRRLSELLIAGIDDADVWRPAVLAHWEAQSYKDEEYVDLADFCDRLRLHIGDAAIQRCCTEVIEALTRIVGTSCVSGYGFQFSRGLSIYFPWCNDAVKSKGANGASQLSTYQELAFSRETLWGSFLDAYLRATRREPSRGPAATCGGSFEAVLPESTVESQQGSEEKEMTMTIKRVPPWMSKGSPGAATIKNHPRDQGPAKPAVPVRSVPPWIGKGTVEGPSRIKNHPWERND